MWDGLQGLASRVLRDTAEAGIGAGVNVIVGFPGETEGDFLDLLDELELRPRLINCTHERKAPGPP